MNVFHIILLIIGCLILACVIYPLIDKICNNCYKRKLRKHYERKELKQKQK